MATRFTRSTILPKDVEEAPGRANLDISNHSSRYARSALDGKLHHTPSMRYVGPSLFFLQVGFIFLFIFGTKPNNEEYNAAQYMIFRDIMAMLLIGFGYLMTFLRKYGLGAVGFTMLLTALGMQLNIFMELFVNFMYGSDHAHFPLELTLTHIIDAEFFAATLLISYGAVIGRASPFQLILIMLFECFFYGINKVMVVLGQLQAEDVGGSITIHMFGAYFGIWLSFALGPQEEATASNADARRFSDLMSLIGTTVLWVFWPSFVGATETAAPENEERCVINTILALLGSTAATFYVSLFLGKRKFDAVHVANSTLAGGVAVGASARLNLGPGGSVLLGVLAGIVSVLGYFYCSPFLEDRLGLNDTCGVHNLHGMPAVLGGLASAVFVSLDSEAVFLSFGRPKQAWHQVAATVATVAIGSATGYFTGKIIACAGFDIIPEYDDSVWWFEGEYYEAVNTVDEIDENADRSVSKRSGKAFFEKMIGKDPGATQHTAESGSGRADSSRAPVASEEQC